MSKKKAPVQHGFLVRLVTHAGAPAGVRWFNTARAKKRSPALLHFLVNIRNDKYARVASITPATQAKRGA